MQDVWSGKEVGGREVRCGIVVFTSGMREEEEWGFLPPDIRGRSINFFFSSSLWPPPPSVPFLTHSIGQDSSFELQVLYTSLYKKKTMFWFLFLTGTFFNTVEPP